MALDDIDVAAKGGNARAAAPAPMPSTPSYTIPEPDTSKVTEGLRDIQERKIDATGKAYDSLTGTLDNDLANLRKRADTVGVEAGNLQPWNHEQESAKYRSDPISNFSSLGSVFGILASAFTRAPMENSLNASAAAMNAITEGNVKDYDRAYKAWQDNNKQALERHRIQNDAYQTAATLLSTNMSAGKAKLEVLAARFGDEKMRFLLQNGMDKEVFDLMSSRQKLALELGQAQPKIWLENTKMQDLLGRGYDPRNPTSPQSSQALQSWQQTWNGRRYDEDADWAAKWHVENPEGTSEQFSTDYAAHRNKLETARLGGRIPKPEEAEINRRKDQYIKEGLSETEAYTRAVQEVRRAGTTLSGNRIDDLTGKIDRIGNMEATIGKVEELLKKHKAITGLGGQITRPAEIISNIFGSNDTDRKQFQRYISELQEWGPQALNDRQGRPLASEVGKINNIIAGLALGDTAANTARAYLELRELLGKMKKDLETRRSGPAPAQPGPPAAPATPKAAPGWRSAPVVGPRAEGDSEEMTV